jgi:hypothetical protein
MCFQFFFVDVLKLIEAYKNEPLSVIINKFAVSWADMINDNQTVINSRAKGINQMLGLIASGLISLAIAFLITAIPLT